MLTAIITGTSFSQQVNPVANFSIAAFVFYDDVSAALLVSPAWRPPRRLLNFHQLFFFNRFI
jgi:hypothetical protein